MTIHPIVLCKHFFPYVICLLLVAACVGTQDNQQPVPPEQLAKNKGYELVKPVKSVRNYRIDGWHYINNRAITLEAGVNERYLVTLLQSCQGLRGSELIATTSTVGQLTTFDSIIIGKYSGGPQRCAINGLYKLKKKPLASS